MVPVPLNPHVQDDSGYHCCDHPPSTPQVGQLLEVLQGEMSREALQIALSLRDSQRYLKPALVEGVIEITLSRVRPPTVVLNRLGEREPARVPENGRLRIGIFRNGSLTAVRRGSALEIVRYAGTPDHESGRREDADLQDFDLWRLNQRHPNFFLAFDTVSISVIRSLNIFSSLSLPF